MNRREFLKSLFATGALVATNPEIALEQLLTDTVKFDDNQFITYIYYNMNFVIHNPSQIMIITDIGEE